MATLLLTAVGTALGGPLGGAIGALAGRSIDGAIIGGGKREGPRLKELAVTTSSYGLPIARQHGRMRAAGTIIWATDLVEHKDKTGGKKGQPSVTSYAYTSSFAVALSSRPIVGVGRVWADGNLLRGAAGDLKTAGAMRIHTGRGDQAPDPLIAAAQASACPAFRDCAYVVFEDLALEQFGNRIPALTFEITADDGAIGLAELVGSIDAGVTTSTTVTPLVGFANEGGPLAATLDTIDTLFPLSVDAGGARLTIGPAGASNAPFTLPSPARAWDENDFGLGEGRRQDRDAGETERIGALRYYDLARDFQPGVQRPGGRATVGAQRTIEFPGAFAAEDARALAESAARRLRARRETLQWRLAELDPALAPGVDVKVPGEHGIWRIETWEWREHGIELGLTRRDPQMPAGKPADPGTVQPPADGLAGPTILRAFELPPVSIDPSERTLFAAATGMGAWNGCALYLDRAGELVPTASTGRTRATIATLASPLAPSPGLLFEPQAMLELALLGASEALSSVSLGAVLQGANRLLVGGEVLQFAHAEPTGGATWRLTGLLRGRGGTEAAALIGHAPGTPVVLIDDSLVSLDPAQVPSHAATTIAAIGPGDAEPVYAALANAGLGHKPLIPVHPRCVTTSTGSLLLEWVRRARGAWNWSDGIDCPLVEETEAYRVGFGPVDAPIAEWRTETAHLEIDLTMVAALAADYPGEPLWVRQIGQFAQSDALLLGRPG